MVGYKLFVEGGGDAKSLRIACRNGFTEFFKQAGLVGKLPHVVSCGGRKKAYDDFCTAIQNREAAFLLVDSEDLVDEQHRGKPWRHLKQRKGDGWKQPGAATEDHCHLMVACMESWFLADADRLKTFFGQGFNANALPARDREIESISRRNVANALSKATSQCKTKGCYKKGQHSFKILAQIDPHKVCAASPWAKRLIDTFRKNTPNQP